MAAARLPARAKKLQQSAGPGDTVRRTAMHLGQRPDAVQNPPPPPLPPQRRCRLRRRCHSRHQAAVVGGQQRRIAPAALGGPHTTKDAEGARAEGAEIVSCRARGGDVDHDNDDCRGRALVQFDSQNRQASPQAPAVVKGTGSPTNESGIQNPTRRHSPAQVISRVGAVGAPTRTATGRTVERLRGPGPPCVVPHHPGTASCTPRRPPQCPGSRLPRHPQGTPQSTIHHDGRWPPCGTRGTTAPAESIYGRDQDPALCI